MTEENTQTPSEEKVEAPVEASAKGPESTEGQKEEKKEEKAPEAPAKEEKSDVEVPKKFKALVEQIEALSVLELSELVKVLEEKFGVSAAAPMAVAGPAVGGDAGAVEEKSEFDIELTEVGGNKISVIKAVKEITGLGLKDAKDLVDAAPKVVKEKVPKAEAEELKNKLVEAGATVNLK